MKFRITFYTCLFAFLLILFAMPSQSFAQIKLNYKLSMSKPYTHYFEVETKITGLKKNYIDFLMPVWAPGSYLVRDFPKNVEFFKAFDGAGNDLKFEKINKYTWRVYSNKSNEVNLHTKFPYVQVFLMNHTDT